MKYLTLLMIVFAFGCTKKPDKKPILGEFGCTVIKAPLTEFVASGLVCEDRACVEKKIQNGLAKVNLCTPIAIQAKIIGDICKSVSSAVITGLTQPQLDECKCTGGDLKEKVLAGVGSFCEKL